jgi:hypothetical protein
VDITSNTFCKCTATFRKHSISLRNPRHSHINRYRLWNVGILFLTGANRLRRIYYPFLYHYCFQISISTDDIKPPLPFSVSHMLIENNGKRQPYTQVRGPPYWQDRLNLNNKLNVTYNRNLAKHTRRETSFGAQVGQKCTSWSTEGAEIKPSVTEASILISKLDTAVDLSQLKYNKNMATCRRMYSQDAIRRRTWGHWTHTHIYIYIILHFGPAVS